ncbi:MAG: MATE family efflux transporter [Bacteroidia bacterium]|nr:MATE family efflux transporter [Bacteroidia bacterium]
MNHSEELGTKPIGNLLRAQAIPASVGILIMSIYGIVDTIFVGRWVGTLGIGAITVVLPITFLISSIGMSIGIGGASVISRALGSGNRERALLTFGNQATLTLILAVGIVLIGSFFQESILRTFGGRGDILPYAKEYFQIILLGIPFLAWAMMTNNVIRSEGAAKFAMMIMIVPAVMNMILDPILIGWFDMGISGAAWATTFSYMASAAFSLWYFFKGPSGLKLKVKNLSLKRDVVKEIFSIGIITLIRQGTISLLAIFLNNALFSYGGEMGVSVYGIINRVMMFANFPVLGVTHGFLPIAGYNFGAQKWDRVKEVIFQAIIFGTGIAFIIFLGIMFFAKEISALFTNDSDLIALSTPAIMTVFLATPTLTIQLIGSAYFQSIGKAVPALLLTMLKQGFFLIPLILILPAFFDLNGVWYAFPIADILTALVNLWFIRMALRQLSVPLTPDIA